MEPHFRNYQMNHKFQEKVNGYYCWKLRKRKVKHQTLAELEQYPIGNVY